jgi:transcriptional regulator with XRE-family HTH domain
VRLQSTRELALLVTRRRKDLGMTQEQLARRAGVRRATLADLERGDSTPSFATATRLLAALDLVLDASPTPDDGIKSETARRPRPSLDDVLARNRE